MFMFSDERQVGGMNWKPVIEMDHENIYFLLEIRTSLPPSPLFASTS
jgi:hypothetical protein